MKESDWKIFKQIKEKALEKFCQESLNEFEEAINNIEENAHTRYTLVYRLVQNRDKRLALLFDEHSRSYASIQLTALRGEGLVDEELLKKLSSDFLEMD